MNLLSLTLLPTVTTAVGATTPAPGGTDAAFLNGGSGKILWWTGAKWAGMTFTSGCVVNFGATPLAMQTFTIAENQAQSGGMVTAVARYIAVGSKDLDDMEMEDLVCQCDAPVGGFFQLTVSERSGCYLEGSFAITYTIVYT